MATRQISVGERVYQYESNGYKGLWEGTWKNLSPGLNAANTTYMYCGTNSPARVSTIAYEFELPDDIDVKEDDNIQIQIDIILGQPDINKSGRSTCKQCYVYLSVAPPDSAGIYSLPGGSLQSWRCYGTNARRILNVDPEAAKLVVPGRKYYLYVHIVQVNWYVFEGEIYTTRAGIKINYTYAAANPPTPPTKIEKNDNIEVVAPESNVSFKISGATAGKNDEIAGYQIYYTYTDGGNRGEKEPTDNYYAGPTISATQLAANSDIATFEIPKGAERGEYCFIKVKTLGKTDNMLSSISEPSISYRVNQLPESPTVIDNNEFNKTLTSAADTIIVKGLSTKDPDNENKTDKFLPSLNQQLKYYFKIDNGELTQLNSNGAITIPVNLLPQGKSAIVYIYSFDGLEYCEVPLPINVARRKRPVITSFNVDLVAGRTDNNCSSRAYCLADSFILNYSSDNSQTNERAYASIFLKTTDSNKIISLGKFTERVTLGTDIIGTGENQFSRGEVYQLGVKYNDGYEDSEILWSTQSYQYPYLPEKRKDIQFLNNFEGKAITQDYLGTILKASWTEPALMPGYATTTSYVVAEILDPLNQSKVLDRIFCDEPENTSIFEDKVDKTFSREIKDLPFNSVNNTVRLGVYSVDTFNGVTISYFTSSDGEIKTYKNISAPFINKDSAQVSRTLFKPINDDKDLILSFSTPLIFSEDNNYSPFKIVSYTIFTKSFSNTTEVLEFNLLDEQDKRYVTDRVDSITEIRLKAGKNSEDDKIFANYFNLSPENKNKQFSNVIFSVYAIDELGQKSNVIVFGNEKNKSIIVDFRCKPYFTNAILTAAAKLYLDGTQFVDRNLNTNFLQSDKNLLNPSDVINFTFPQAKDDNDNSDIEKYLLFCYQYDNKTSLDNLRNNLDNYSQVAAISRPKVGWDDEQMINIEYTLPSVSQNKFLTFFVEAVDKTGLVSDPLFLDYYLVLCRLSKPSFKIENFNEVSSVDESSNYFFTLKCLDNGGSIPALPYEYRDYPNLSYESNPKYKIVVYSDINPNPTEVIYQKEINLTNEQVEQGTLFSVDFSYLKTLGGNTSLRYFKIEIQSTIYPGRVISPVTLDYILYGNAPTIAKRKNQLGLNFNNFYDDDVLVISPFNNRKKIRIISENGQEIRLDLAGHGEIEGGFFNGGSWDSSRKINFIPSYGLSFYTYTKEKDYNLWKYQFMVYGPIDLTDSELIAATIQPNATLPSDSKIIVYVNKELGQAFDEDSSYLTITPITNNEQVEVDVNIQNFYQNGYIYVGIETLTDIDSIEIVDLELQN